MGDLINLPATLALDPEFLLLQDNSKPEVISPCMDLQPRYLSSGWSQEPETLNLDSSGLGQITSPGICQKQMNILSAGGTVILGLKSFLQIIFNNIAAHS